MFYNICLTCVRFTVLFSVEEEEEDEEEEEKEVEEKE